MAVRAGLERMLAGADTCPVRGIVHWSPAKSLWMGGMTMGALLAPFVAAWDAAALFVFTTGVTLCFGHSSACTGG
jgi:stearoyl-CoA desaturase (delta-9 desaturase)